MKKLRKFYYWAEGNFITKRAFLAEFLCMCFANKLLHARLRLVETQGRFLLKCLAGNLNANIVLRVCTRESII